MSNRQQLRFGRPALALGARVVGATADTLSFALQREALSEKDRRWIAQHESAADSCASQTVHLPRAAMGTDAQGPPCLALLRASHDAWSAAHRAPAIMAVLNVTPDSFSDGGEHLDPADAIAAGLRYAEQGAHWLDVGGESTRPGAAPVAVEEELARVLPVVRGLSAAGLKHISIDTRRARVAEAALDAGATMVNDVGAGLDDERMLEVVAAAGCCYALMHRQGDPKHMQRAPAYTDVLGQVTDFLRRRVAACLEAGIAEERLLLDPGLGFGKRLEHNLALLRRLSELRSLGLPLLVGPSRKSFIGHITGTQRELDWARQETRDNPLERLGGTAAAITFCVAGGAEVLRVHDVAVMSEACAVAAAIQASPASHEPLPC